MPIYDYQCKQCGHRFERIQNHSDPEVKECPKCGSEVERLITAPSVHFKGSGWYATDYAKKSGSSSDSASSSSSESSASPEKKDSGSKNSGSPEKKSEKPDAK